MASFAEKMTGREYTKFFRYVTKEIILGDCYIGYHNLGDRLVVHWEREQQKPMVYNEEVFKEFIKDEYMHLLFNRGEYYDWGDDWNMYYLLGRLFEDAENYGSDLERISKAIQEQDEQFLLSLLALNIDIDDVYELFGLELWEKINQNIDLIPPDGEEETQDQFLTRMCENHKCKKEPLPIDEQYKELVFDEDYQKWLRILHIKVHPWIRKEENKVYTLKPVKPKSGTPEYGRWYRANKLTPEKKAEYKARAKAKEEDFRSIVRAEFFRKLEPE